MKTLALCAITSILPLAVSTAMAAEAVGGKPAAPAKKWVLPRTPDGQPDFSGVWSNASNVPLERAKELGTKEFFTPEELAQRESKAADAERNAEQQNNAGTAHYDMTQFGLDRAHFKIAKSERTSILTGPEGRIPPLLPDAQKRAAERAAFNRVHGFDGPETRGLSERCILWANEGPPLLPQGYNSNIQIFQGPGYFALETEMNHDVRMIRLNGKHIAPDIRLWFGDSIGHWEGDTLVIDTTNFSEKVNYRGSTSALHVVEKINRVDADTLRYQFTVEDPNTWAKPWSGEYFITKTNDRVFEYACHEGNLGMANILSGARADEARKAAEAAKAK